MSNHCVLSYLPSEYGDISFNTKRRYFDDFFNEWKTDTKTNIISVERNGYSNRALKQMDTLVSVGIFSVRNKEHVNVGHLNIYGYYSEPVNNNREKTSTAIGNQYQLTQLGSEYITHSENSNSSIQICIGHNEVKDIFILEADPSFNRYRVSFTTKLINIPQWTNNHDVIRAFSSIHKSINDAKEMKGDIYISKREKGDWFIESDQIYLTIPDK